MKRSWRRDKEAPIQSKILLEEKAGDDHRLILTINSGSSSIKFSIYRMGPSESMVLYGKLDRIGVQGGHFEARDDRGTVLVDQQLDLPAHNQALEALLDWLKGQNREKDLQAVGHRIVHGGAAHLKPSIITPEIMDDLQKLVPLAPDHLPHEIEAIKTLTRRFPHLPQIACFDTAFHRCMPDVAQRIALPQDYVRAGVMRYGFHGLSYEFLLQELDSQAGAESARGRVIIAHLGNGASMVAVKNGKSQDTTMGMTPTGGLVMSTRCGDMDPGVILYLLRQQGLTPDDLDNLLNKRAGLLGVSEISSDVQDLLAAEDHEPQAAAALALFCHQARKFIGALTAVLGGLETLVFTGGIGENSSIIRQRLCQNLEFLGIVLDPDRNDAHAPIISRADSRVTVRVMKTNEELMIARHTHALLAKGGDG
jgi:acetate kinase